MNESYRIGRIEDAIGDVLADNQYGFRKGCSTLDAVKRVVNIAKEAVAGTRCRREAKKLLSDRHNGHKKCLQLRKVGLHLASNTRTRDTAVPTTDCCRLFEK